MSSDQSSGTFNPRVVLAMLVFGVAVFFAMLYLIGSGQTGRDINDGGGHASGRGLNGFFALAEYLEAEGHDVSRARSAAGYDDYGLLVLTPPHYVDEDQLSDIISGRRFTGPTLIILPKWNAAAIPRQALAKVEAKEGWVQIYGFDSPDWSLEDTMISDLDLEIEKRSSAAWESANSAGILPQPDSIQSMSSGAIASLAKDANGQTLAGYVDDGDYIALAALAGSSDQLRVEVENSDDDEEYYGFDQYPLIVVSEPDLLNNWGFNDRRNAIFAHQMIDAAMDDADMPVVFDLTLNGLGAQKNLLTLAFSPPFLAATICSLIALIAVGWRAFRRFGPPLIQGPSIAYGKRQLVTNSAGIIRRTGRHHLLGEPYAELMSQRIAAALGIRHHDDEAISRALAARQGDVPSFTENAHILRNSRNVGELLRAATALKSIERLLER